MKKAINLKKNEIINAIQTVNNDFTPNKKVKISDLEKEVRKEWLHPQGYTTDRDLKVTFALFIHSLGLTVKTNKKYGVVGKQGRKTVIEMYDMTEYDNRVHVYGHKEILESLTNNKNLKGFLTTNEKWSLEQRFEITSDSWCDFIEPMYHEYLVATK